MNRRPGNLLHETMLVVGLDKWSIGALLVKPIQDKRDIRREEDTFIDMKDPNCLNEKRGSGVYRDEYSNDKEYQKARYSAVDKEKETARGKKKWELVKSVPEKLDHRREYKRRWEKERKARLLLEKVAHGNR